MSAVIFKLENRRRGIKHLGTWSSFVDNEAISGWDLIGTCTVKLFCISCLVNDKWARNGRRTDGKRTKNGHQTENTS